LVTSDSAAAPPLELIPLGGLGEFGMNMMLVACGGTAILVDAGVMFPEPDLLGVDLIIPDLRPLQRYRPKALVLTR
jgi:ribonuclease J